MEEVDSELEDDFEPEDVVTEEIVEEAEAAAETEEITAYANPFDLSNLFHSILDLLLSFLDFFTDCSIFSGDFSAASASGNYRRIHAGYHV